MKLIAHIIFAAAAVAAPFSAFANAAVPPAKPDLGKGEASFGAVCVACLAVMSMQLFNYCIIVNVFL